MNQEMTLEEAKAFRASLAPAAPKPMSDKAKREAFRIFWAQNKKRYSKAANLENILWLHLQAIKMDEPSKFIDGLNHFGLKKVK